ncbi:MAG: MFS transporter, partial [Streptosporangiaceae bacterium]
ARMPPAVRQVLALTAGVYLTLGVITICEPLYVQRVLHRTLATYGGLLAVVGIAGIFTALAAHRWPPITGGRWAIPAATATLAAGTVLYVSTPVLACAVAGAAVFGAGTALFRLAVRAVIVAAVPASVHGRTLGRWETIQNSFAVAPAAFTGAMVTVLGLRAVLGGCGAFATAVAAASLRPPARASGNRRQPATPSPAWTPSPAGTATGAPPASSTRHEDRAGQQPSSALTSGGPWGQHHRQPDPALLDPDRFRLPPAHPATRQPVPPRRPAGPTTPL